MRIIRNLILIIFLLAVGYFLFKYKQSRDEANPLTDLTKDSVYIFPGVKGPMNASIVQPMHRTSWKKYATGEDYGIAVLLLDSSQNSNWMGLVHAFKSFGIPFKFYTNVDEALKNDVVYVYPGVDASTNPVILAKLTNFPQRGGTLIGQCVDGGLDQVFGFNTSNGTNQNYRIRISNFNSPILKEFTDPKEKEISLANPQLFKESEGTFNYSGLMGSPLMVYPNGMAFLTERDYAGGGKAYCFGMDLGYWELTATDDRALEAHRTYVNSYEPSMDLVFRIVRNIYTSSSKTAVTLGTVQDNKKLTLCITHDIDYTLSVFNAVVFAKMEFARKIKTTYFYQTKYILDWNDKAFFDDSVVKPLLALDSMKMEIASHSVAHSKVYMDFPLGTGKEMYPTYHPVVKSATFTSGGSVLGELRVSKFLLDHFVKDQQVISFRPGNLALPYSLPQSLIATGYKYSSDVTANDVLTHLPYQLNYDRAYDEEVPAFEFPLTIEDEALPQMDKRLDSALAVAHEISKYGGLMCVLIHPNVVSYKYKFEVGLLDSIQNTAHISTIRDFGDWWAARNNVRFFVLKNATGYQLHIISPAPMDNLTFFVPSTWTCATPAPTAKQTGNSVLVSNVTNGMIINFTAK